MSNQLASSRFRSASSPCSSGSCRARSISSARRSTRNLTPSGSALNWRSKRDPRRLQRLAQLALGGGPLGGPFGLGQGRAAAVDFAAVDVELAGEQPQKTFASVGVEQQIGAAEIGGPRPRRDLAAARRRDSCSICSRSRPISSPESSGRGVRVKTPRADSAMSRQAPRRLLKVRSKTPSKNPAGGRSFMAAIAAVAEPDRDATAASPSTSKRSFPASQRQICARPAPAPRPDPRRPARRRSGQRRRHAATPPPPPRRTAPCPAPAAPAPCRRAHRRCRPSPDRAARWR